MIKVKDIIQEPENPSKGGKEDSITDGKKHNPKKRPPLFKNKEDYIGGTNEKTCETDDSQSETGGCERNLGEEHKNEEDE